MSNEIFQQYKVVDGTQEYRMNLSNATVQKLVKEGAVLHTDKRGNQEIHLHPLQKFIGSK